jgi:hypothetical protein
MDSSWFRGYSDPAAREVQARRKPARTKRPGRWATDCGPTVALCYPAKNAPGGRSQHPRRDVRAFRDMPCLAARSGRRPNLLTRRIVFSMTWWDLADVANRHTTTPWAAADRWQSTPAGDRSVGVTRRLRRKGRAAREPCSALGSVAPTGAIAPTRAGQDDAPKYSAFPAGQCPAMPNQSVPADALGACSFSSALALISLDRCMTWATSP